MTYYIIDEWPHAVPSDIMSEFCFSQQTSDPTNISTVRPDATSRIRFVFLFPMPKSGP